jgi:hypothetical protein
MNSTKPARTVSLSWKGKAVVFAGSLVFIMLALSMVAGVLEDPMFLQRARGRLDQMQSQFDRGVTREVERELRVVRGEIEREKALINRYMMFAIVMALANALLAVWLIGRSRSTTRFVMWMTFAGLAWGLSLTSLYGTMHRQILQDGLQDPRFRGLLCLCLFAFSLLDGLVVAGTTLRAARPKARKTSA